ncbi:FAD/NAD(P)-binding domain-containing protein, partial [Glonium stellatum]
KVVAVFADGTRARGDVLVGCDGARSRVREALCGVEGAAVTALPVWMINFTQGYGAEQARHVRSLNPVFATSVHPELEMMFWLSIQDVPDPEKPETWIFQLLISWLDNPIPEAENNDAGRLAFVRRVSEQWAEPWKSAGLWVKEGTRIPLDQGTCWERATPWDNRKGRMTLCGDAAHPMPPHRGQGLNVAIQDASLFAAAIIEAASGAKSLSEAIDAYDKEMFERGTKEMKISVAQSKAIHKWETLMESPLAKIGMRQTKKAETGVAE